MSVTPSSASRGFKIGDQVVAAGDIGGVWNPQIRKGTTGEILERAANGQVLVQFEGHRSQLVDADRLIAVSSAPPAPGPAVARRRWFRRNWPTRH